MTSRRSYSHCQNAYKRTVRNPRQQSRAMIRDQILFWECENIEKYSWCTEGLLWEWMSFYTAVGERGPLWRSALIWDHTARASENRTGLPDSPLAPRCLGSAGPFVTRSAWLWRNALPALFESTLQWPNFKCLSEAPELQLYNNKKTEVLFENNTFERLIMSYWRTGNLRIMSFLGKDKLF